MFQLRLIAVVGVATIASLSAGATGAAGAAGASVGLSSAGAQSTSVVTLSDVEGIEALLAVRSTAVESNDATAHASTVDSAASEAFREVDSRTVSAGATIGLDGYHETLFLPVVDLTPPGGERLGVARTVTLEVRRTHRVAEYDDRDHVASLFLTFIERADGWKVLGDDALASIGLAGDRELWELYETSIVRRDRVLVIGTATQSRHRVIADIVESALARFDQNWSDPWQERVVMIVPRETSEIEALLQPTIDVSKFVAFTTLGVDRAQGWTVVAPRIVAQEANLALRTRERQVQILVHELAHVASVTSSGPATPLWAHEGLAEWITAGRPTTTDGDLELPDLHRFRTGSSADIREVYDQASSTMAQLAGTYGDDAPWALFRGIGAATSEPGTADHVLDSALIELTGSGIEELTR